MSKMTIELEWDEELGEKWMNEDNLRLLLFTAMATKTELLKVNVKENEL